MVLNRSQRRTAIFIGLLLGFRLTWDASRAASYVFPQYDLSHWLIFLLLFELLLVTLLLCALVLAVRRLFQRRLPESLGVLAVLALSIWPADLIDGPTCKFLLHRSEYRSAVSADQTASTRYRVFSWGNRNTQLWGGGVIFEAIVYDESDEIVRPPQSWSAGWLQRRQLESKENLWITEIREGYPPCRKRVKNLDAHFYFVSEECG
jgi:hypothetical protein